MRYRCLAAFIAMLMALLIGCGDGDAADSTDDTMSGSASATTRPPTTAPSHPEPAPTPAEQAAPPSPLPIPEQLDFAATTIDGGSFDGASLAGAPAVLWFWAPWCPVCAREAPLIADLAKRYAGQVTFVGIAGLSGDADAIRRFVDEGGVGGVTHLDDRDGAIYAHFGVTQQYDIGFVTADGTVDIKTGPLTESEITAEVERLALS